MSSLERLQVQLEHAKRVHDKKSIEKISEKIDALKEDEIEPYIIKKTQYTCESCSHKIQKVFNNGFRDYEGFYCESLKSELIQNKDNTFSRHIMIPDHYNHPFYDYIEIVHHCNSHSNYIEEVESKPVIIKSFNEYPLLFTFARNYTKLNSDRFTTIRSVTFNKTCKDAPNFKKGTIGRYSVGGFVQPRLIIVRNWMDKKIEDFELTTLQKDIAPDICTTKQEFVDKLNELYTKLYTNANNRLTTIKRLFDIQKINNLTETQAKMNNKEVIA